MSASRIYPTCASCQEFPLAESEKTGGKAQCQIRESEYSFDDQHCVLYTKASDREARRAIVIRLMQK